jgi:alcohol dehydrogenase class IV
MFDQLHVPATVRAAGVALESWDQLREPAVAHVARSPAVLANPRVPSTTEVGELLDSMVGR